MQYFENEKVRRDWLEIGFTNNVTERFLNRTFHTIPVSEHTEHTELVIASFFRPLEKKCKGGEG